MVFFLPLAHTSCYNFPFVFFSAANVGSQIPKLRLIEVRIQMLFIIDQKQMGRKETGRKQIIHEAGYRLVVTLAVSQFQKKYSSLPRQAFKILYTSFIITENKSGWGRVLTG